MTPTLIPAALLLAALAIGILGLRPFSPRVRLGFDFVCFLAISAFLFVRGVSPFFAPPNGPLDSEALWLRVIGGAWWLLGARVFVATLWYGFHRDRRSRETRLFSDLTAAGVYIATALVVLNSVLALPITGLLATSGVVAIVLGLALQNTLADVFAGIAVGIEAPFGVGDRVVIGDKIEGQVIQVNWRSIRVQTDGDDVAIIPNSLVAKADILNRSFPTKRRAVTIELPGPASAVPERVIDTLLESTLLCKDILQVPAPSVALTRLGMERNAYAISFYVEDTKHLSPTKGALLRFARRQLHYAELLDRSLRTAALPSGSGDQLAVSLPQQILSSLVLFEGLAKPQIDALAAQMAPRTLEAGDVLFAQGAVDATLYIVVSGVVAVTHQTDAAAATLIGCIGAGDYIGEISLLTGAPHAASATARTHCHIYTLAREAIAPLIEGNSQLAAAFDRSARRGLNLLHREVAVRATESVGASGQLLLRIRSFFQFDPS